MESHHVFLAEGAYGTVTTKLLAFRNVEMNRSLALGAKGEWELTSKQSVGDVYHTFGWPPTAHTSFGGGFIYFYNNALSIGYVTHLDCKTLTYVLATNSISLKLIRRFESYYWNHW
ncbi:MAG: NAD(P)/FAD-dependent oxidoreductase [Candidatus Hodgkinia cicadicola]